MNELPIETFVNAIRKTHGCGAELRSDVPVSEQFEGQTVWKGRVLVFDLIDHPTATTCCAWSVGNRVTAVLHEGPVDSPQAAVRAAIAAEHREG